MTEEAKLATNFGADVFGEEAIKTYLSKDTAKKLQATIQEGKPLDPSIAGEVAHGIRHKTLPVFSVQYHPESCPGPHDSKYLFNGLKELIAK